MFQSKYASPSSFTNHHCSQVPHAQENSPSANKCNIDLSESRPFKSLFFS